MCSGELSALIGRLMSKGWYTYDVQEEGWWIRQKWDVIGGSGVGVSECSGCPMFIFFIKENWMCAMTRYHVEPNINILLTWNLSFDSDVRHWTYPLMIPLHCLWAKSLTPGQFERDLTWFYFCFDFVRSHERCGCCSIVCLRFQVVQIKQVDCKMTTKNVNNHK